MKSNKFVEELKSMSTEELNKKLLTSLGIGVSRTELPACSDSNELTELKNRICILEENLEKANKQKSLLLDLINLNS